MSRGQLVDAQWLHARLGRPDVVVLEANLEGTGREHIPGARIFDLKAAADPHSSLAHTLPDAGHFARAAAAVGALGRGTIVIYDSTGIAASARAWWMFKVFGFADVHVLNGGLAAWKVAGYSVQEEPSSLPAQGEPHAVRLQAERLATFEMVRLASQSNAQIADARPAARFEGKASEPRPGIPGGHIPNSTSLPYTTLLDMLGRLLPNDALRAKFMSAGIDPDAPVICTCGSGVTACVLALALQELGNSQVRVYDGSWSEWAQHLQHQETST